MSFILLVAIEFLSVRRFKGFTDICVLIHTVCTSTDLLNINIFSVKEYYCPVASYAPNYTRFDLHGDGVRIDTRTNITFQTKGKSRSFSTQNCFTQMFKFSVNYTQQK